MNTLVLILSPDHREYEALLAPLAGLGAVLHGAADPVAAEPWLAEAEVILARPSLLAPVLSRCTKVRWVQSAFAGIEPFCDPSLRRDYVLTGVKNIFGAQMSEYVFARILEQERNHAAFRLAQEQRAWSPMAHRSLSGLRLGVAGLGSIGTHVVATGVHFGMEVSGLNRSGRSVEGVTQVYRTDRLHAFLDGLDYLVLTLPHTAETRGVINAKALACLGPGATLINVGRGSLVDEPALVAALGARSIRAAVLDVFAAEPLAPESPLWSLPNCVITPHIAAKSFPADIAGIFRRNFEAYQSGTRMDGIVDLEKGY